MKKTAPLLIVAAALFSCNKKQLCAGTETEVPAQIRSISGPDSLAAGDTAAIVLTVAPPANACVQHVTGRIIEMSGNYVQIGATLTESTPGAEHCHCLDTADLKTLVYFTPEGKGAYIFGTQKVKPGVENVSPDSPVYQLLVPR